MLLNIQQLADDLASLTIREAQEFSRYIDAHDGLGPEGALVPCGGPDGGLDARAEVRITDGVEAGV